jgi:hypothetical protein
VVGLALAERRSALAERESATPREITGALTLGDSAAVAPFFVAAALLAIGMQIHTNINATPRFKQFAPADALPWLLPAFSVGMSLLAFVGGRASKRGGAPVALT